MNKVLVSVVIAVYNTEKYISACLDSVINQSLKDIEIIVVNDGSTDLSKKIINDYLKIDKRIKILDQDNQGAAIARNRGLSIVSGKYVIFFDSDDIMYPDLLTSMYEKAEDYSSDIVVCQTNRVIDNNLQEQTLLEDGLKFSYLKKRKIFAPQEVAQYLYQIFNGWAWDKLISVKFLRDSKIKFQKLRHTNDLFFTFSLLSLSNKISIVKKPLIVHRYHSFSLEATRFRNPDCFYYAIKKLFYFLKRKGVYAIYEQSFINFVISFSLWHIRSLYKYDLSVVVLFKQLLNLIDFKYKSSELFYDEKGYLDAKEIFLGNINSYEFILNQQDRREQEIIQIKEQLAFYTSFLRLKTDTQKLYEYLKRHAINDIILYGVGTCGQIFFDLLESYDVKIIKGYDSNISKYKNLNISNISYKDINKMGNNFTIIVTVLGHCEEIVSTLRNQNNCRVLSLKEICNNIFDCD